MTGAIAANGASNDNKPTLPVRRVPRKPAITVMDGATVLGTAVVTDRRPWMRHADDATGRWARILSPRPA